MMSKIEVGGTYWWNRVTVEDNIWHQVTVTGKDGRYWKIDTPVGQRRVMAGRLFAQPLRFGNYNTSN